MNALRRACLSAAVLLAGLAFTPPRLAAQGPGSIQGTVRDRAGAPVASAVVDAEGAVRRGTTTDAAGRYRLEGLTPGRYRLRVRHPGYFAASGTVTVGAGEAAVRDFVLPEQTLLIDTVTVISDNPVVIRREETDFGTEVKETAIELMPLRPSIGEVVALTPGARAEQVWGGATGQANNYQLDGLAANHPGLGGELLQLSLSWLQSVEVRGLGAPAEYGNFQGGLVNARTKSGTNDFEGAFRFTGEGARLSASNLQEHDVASEVSARWDMEGEARGPLVRNRLFYYVAGQHVRRDDRVVNHLLTRNGFFGPDPVESAETRMFGKLSWQPTSADQLVLSGGFMDTRVDRFGATGYEEGAYLRTQSPTLFGAAGLTHVFGQGRLFQASAAAFTRDERRDPYADPETPGIVLFGQGARPTYQSVPFRYRMAPTVVSGAASLVWDARTGFATHQVKIGGDLSSGRWISQRLRNGGMTWRPNFGRNYESFFPQHPDTWTRGGFVPISVGGEADLDADVRNAAVFVQDQIAIGSRISINPGVRFGWWSGYLSPAEGIGPRFRVVDDRAVEGRLGLSIDLTGRNDLVLKGHVGRYHQSMFAQLFDRAEGANVFRNEQLWYWFGTPTDPARAFTAEERDAMAAAGTLRLQEEVRINQTGPVLDYRQPYIDQLVVGLEKQLGRWWKAELVYVQRNNENMVALVDRNAATNYTMFEGVQVLGQDDYELTYDGGPVVLPRIYIPNYILVEELKLIEQGYQRPFPPGLTLADTARLTWDPDLVLTNVPEATRTLRQAQLVVRMGHPRAGGTASVVYTRLRGNLDNVSGYAETDFLGAGPFVNPNQGVNSLGRLANSSEWEMRLWMYGQLPVGFRGGISWSHAIGDRLTPTFSISSLYRYRDAEGRPLSSRLVTAVAGQPVYLEERGSRTYSTVSTIDLHLERATRLRGAEWIVMVDAFNLTGTAVATRINASVNGSLEAGGAISGGTEPENEYAAVRDRVRPRSLRLGAAIRF